MAVLNWAVRKKMVSGDTVPQIDLPPEGQAKITYLDEDEETIFYAQAMGDSVGKKTLTRVTRFVALALDTAARKEAIESLTWDRVDLKNNLISFKDPLRHVTKKRRSEVPIPRRLRPLLERAFKEKTNRYVVGGGDVKKAFLTWVATSCRPDIRAHDLRRTWATLSARAGVPLIDIADVLGDTMEVVMKHYRVFQPKHLQSAMDARWEE